MNDEKEHIRLVLPEEGKVIHRTFDFSQDPPEWHVVKEAREGERFMDMHCRGDRVVLISDVAIYTSNNIRDTELVFETFSEDSF